MADTIVKVLRGPAGTPHAAKMVRIHARRIASHPEKDKLKMVIQNITGGVLDSLHPIVVEYVTEQEVNDYINNSINEGWVLNGR
jgi:hypothetical protein